jgi:putative transposase
MNRVATTAVVGGAAKGGANQGGDLLPGNRTSPSIWYSHCMKTPGSKALRLGRISVPEARYLITKNVQEGCGSVLIQGENPSLLIDWFFTAQGRGWFTLHAFVIMPHHYHLVIMLGKETTLSEAIGKVNENGSRLIKRAMKIRETFWQDGFHDHLIRPADSIRKYIDYVHMNPVEAKLVASPEEWPFSSAHPRYAGRACHGQ